MSVFAPTLTCNCPMKAVVLAAGALPPGGLGPGADPGEPSTDGPGPYGYAYTPYPYPLGAGTGVAVLDIPLDHAGRWRGTIFNQGPANVVEVHEQESPLGGAFGPFSPSLGAIPVGEALDLQSAALPDCAKVLRLWFVLDGPAATIVREFAGV